MSENESEELNPFARELFNEVTPFNMVKLNYWLAGIIVVVTGSVVGSYYDGIQDQARDEALSAIVEKQSITVGALSDAQITSDAQLQSHLTLHKNDQDDNDRRFMEIITRLDEAIGRIR